MSIWESHYWRRELRLMKSEFSVWGDELAEESLSEEATFRIEKSLFLSAFAIRKLIEGQKIPDRIVSKNFGLSTFPPNDEHLREKVLPIEAEDFALDKGEICTMSAKRVGDEIIHSNILTYLVDDDQRLSGFYLCSDQNLGKRLLELPLITWTDWIESIVNGWVVSTHRSRDPDTQKIVTRLE